MQVEYSLSLVGIDVDSPKFFALDLRELGVCGITRDGETLLLLKTICLLLILNHNVKRSEKFGFMDSHKAI